MTVTRSRRLYLVRHGEAKPKDEDPQRGLTESGRVEVDRMAAWGVAAGIRVDEIRHSGKLRAQQTAEIWAESLGTSARAVDGLAPNDDVADVAARIESESGTVMLVGHLPLLEWLAALMTARDPAMRVVNLDAGALVELTATDGPWSITGLMQPRLLPAK